MREPRPLIWCARAILLSKLFPSISHGNHIKCCLLCLLLSLVAAGSRWVQIRCLQNKDKYLETTIIIVQQAMG